jgi:hypothetical protein
MSKRRATHVEERGYRILTTSVDIRRFRSRGNTREVALLKPPVSIAVQSIPFQSIPVNENMNVDKEHISLGINHWIHAW